MKKTFVYEYYIDIACKLFPNICHFDSVINLVKLYCSSYSLICFAQICIIFQYLVGTSTAVPTLVNFGFQVSIQILNSSELHEHS